MNRWLLAGTARQERRGRYSSGTYRPPRWRGTLGRVSDIPPALIAEATKRARVIWLTIGPGRPRPAWHIWQPATGPGSAGAAYLLTGPGEQPLPGLAGGGQAAVTVPAARSGGPAVTWTADVTRVLPGSAEWDAVIGPLVAGRLNAVLTGEETSPAPRWARSGAIYRLTPVDRRPR